MIIKEITKNNQIRFIIVDDNGKIIDDAQGYGFKSKQAAHKCYNYKFKGGKEKDDELKMFCKNLLKHARKDNKIEEIKRLLDALDYEYFRNFKDYNHDIDEQNEANKEAELEFKKDFIELLNINVEEFGQYKLGKFISTISKVI